MIKKCVLVLSLSFLSLHAMEDDTKYVAMLKKLEAKLVKEKEKCESALTWAILRGELRSDDITLFNLSGICQNKSLKFVRKQIEKNHEKIIRKTIEEIRKNDEKNTK